MHANDVWMRAMLQHEMNGGEHDEVIFATINNHS